MGNQAIEPVEILQVGKSQLWRITLREDIGRLFAGSDDGTFVEIDLSSHRTIRQFSGHDSGVRSVRVSPDASRAVSSGNDGKIIVWDTNTGDHMVEHEPGSGSIFDLQILPDSEMLVAGIRHSEPLILLSWDLEVLEKLPSRMKEVYSIATIPGATQIVAGGNGMVEIWDVEKLELVDSYPINGSIHGLAATSDGDKIVGAGANSIDVRSRATGRRSFNLEGLNDLYKFGFTLSSDNRLVAAADAHHGQSGNGHIAVWDLANGKLLWKQPFTNDIIRGLAIPRGCEQLITGHVDGSIRFWDLQTASLKPPQTTVHYTNAKIVLVGESSTGKTCIARALMGKDFEPQESTHGMNIWNFDSATVPFGHDESTVVVQETKLWDLAGQVDYQIVHQLFLDETVLALMVFDSTNPNDPFRGVPHWDQALSRVLGAGSPRILVAGRVDRGHPAATSDAIEDYRSRFGFAAFVATSAKTGLGISELKEQVRDAIPWADLPITTSPHLWTQIREYLLQRRNGRHVLTTRKALKTAFRRRYKGVLFDDVEFDTVIAHAKAQGIVWTFSFGDYVLMKPEILNNYAGAIVRCARRQPDGLGCLLERDILDANLDFEDMKRLGRDTERKLLYAVVELFLQRELALRGGARDELVIFPSKLNRGLRDLPLVPQRYAFFRLLGDQEEVYAALVVRLSYSDMLTLSELYQDAALLQDGLGRSYWIQLERSDSSAKLIVSFSDEVSADSKALFLHFIEDHLERRGGDEAVRQQRVYRCGNSSCLREILDHDALQFRLEHGLRTIACQYCDTLIHLDAELAVAAGEAWTVPVDQLNTEVARRRSQQVGVTVSGAKADIGEFDVFLAHNSADRVDVEVLASALRGYGLNPWLDSEQVAPGRWFQDVLQRAIRTAGSAAILIGRSGVGRWELLELRTFISQCVTRDIPVIPVLLPGVASVPDELTFLNELSWVRFDDLTDAEALDRMVWGITGARPHDNLED